jgi:hypothetical protein
VKLEDNDELPTLEHLLERAEGRGGEDLTSARQLSEVYKTDAAASSEFSRILSLSDIRGILHINENNIPLTGAGAPRDETKSSSCQFM